jgi:hypothetical protein
MMPDVAPPQPLNNSNSADDENDGDTITQHCFFQRRDSARLCLAHLQIRSRASAVIEPLQMLDGGPVNANSAHRLPNSQRARALFRPEAEPQ